MSDHIHEEATYPNDEIDVEPPRTETVDSDGDSDSVDPYDMYNDSYAEKVEATMGMEGLGLESQSDAPLTSQEEQDLAAFWIKNQVDQFSDGNGDDDDDDDGEEADYEDDGDGVLTTPRIRVVPHAASNSSNPSVGVGVLSSGANFTAPSDSSWLHGSIPDMIPIYSSYPVSTSSAENVPELYLRRWRYEDLPLYWTAMEKSREFLSKTLPGRAVPDTFESAIEKVETATRQWETGQSFQYFIWGPADDLEDKTETILGAMSLFDRQSIGTMEVGYWVAEDQCRKGIATRCTLALIRTAFQSFYFSKNNKSSKKTSTSSKETQEQDEDVPLGKVALSCLEIYHDKWAERQSGGVAKKLGFLREEETKYEAGSGPACSGIRVRWAYPAVRRYRLDTLRVVADRSGKK